MWEGGADTAKQCTLILRQTILNVKCDPTQYDAFTVVGETQTLLYVR